MIQGTPAAGVRPGVAAEGRKPGDPGKARDAAQQFEALLLGQILRSVRQAGGDSAGECATDFAEQQLALVLARRGGLGLAGLIEAGLKSRAR